jgi:hypothetical protein
MSKNHIRNGASCRFQKLKNTSEKIAQNRAVSIIDCSRKYLLITSAEALGNVVDSN